MLVTFGLHVLCPLTCRFLSLYRKGSGDKTLRTLMHKPLFLIFHLQDEFAPTLPQAGIFSKETLAVDSQLGAARFVEVAALTVGADTGLALTKDHLRSLFGYV